ncbi:hypothetical protein [Paenibacillus alginolyticus]|uniref:hypothetical protein n=1 Tax=Paenibacillus alginolyticus TaxID=59839 RepID=UPI001FE3BA8B|nr:hypothetical protein [Paenibacillus frigoriresistens]
MERLSILLIFSAKKRVSNGSRCSIHVYFTVPKYINWVAAGCLMGMLPITVVYLFLQKFFVKGMADGAIKG